jgi:general secretion pathway protein G
MNTSKTEPLAVVSLALGVASLVAHGGFGFRFILGLLAVCAGHTSQIRIKKHRLGGALALAGLATGYLSVLNQGHHYYGELRYYNNELSKSLEQRVNSDIEAISMQLRTYEMMNYRMPTTEQGLKALVNQPTTEPRPSRWKQLMKTVPVDPWGNEYVYRCPGKSGAAFEIYSLGPDGKESDDDAG